MKNSRIFRYAAIAVVTSLTLSLTSCKKEGCTDDIATNFDSNAKKDNGSCIYPVVTNPTAPTTPIDTTDTSGTNNPNVGKANTDGLKLIGKATSAETKAKLELYAREDLYPGMNLLYIAAYDSETEALLTKGDISFMPMMKMNSGMEHSAPVLNKVIGAANSNGLFSGQVFFVMPSDAGKWTLKTTFKNGTGSSEGEVSFDVTVTQNSNRMMVSFMDTTTTERKSIFLSYALSENPKVGSNELKIVAFTRKNMMEWPAADDLIIEFEPTMPSMGHGSPNNVNPTFTSEGTYIGKVNYTMTGKWQLDLTIKRGTQLLNDELYFDYTL